jgi:hypothetical protein
MTNDAHEQAAALLTEIGRCYATARRYHAIAADCETRIFERALAIGGELRLRTTEVRPELAADAVHELTALRAACEAAVRGVRESAAYRAAEAAWDHERFAEVAALAPAIFDGIEVDEESRTLYLPVAVTGRRGGEHFLAAAVVADRIAALQREGIPRADPPPALGADERLGAVVLDADLETSESPVVLAVEAAALPLPRFRLEPAGETLVYAPRLLVPVRVRLAPSVTDEWWAVRPDAYAEFAATLTAELRARGIDDVDGPEPAAS